MIALVTGGAASGKSAYAEALACGMSPVRTYVATMQNDSAEAAARVEKHRRQRTDAGFETIEICGSLRHVAPTAHALPKEVQDKQAAGVVLLDDIGNLVSNAVFATEGTMTNTDDSTMANTDDSTMANTDDVLARLIREFDDLAAQYAHVVVVGNEVGASGQQFDAATEAWVRVVGNLCRAIAAQSDIVVEVVAGQPNVVKGTAPARPQKVDSALLRQQAATLEMEGVVV